MLDKTIHRLYETGVLQVCIPTHPDIRAFTYEYMGRITTQRVTVDPRMKKGDLLRIARNAARGNLQDMVTVAMLYNVGYGLPYDAKLADVWAKNACIQPAAIGFDAACKLLMKHAHDNPYEIYPDSLLVPCLEIIDQIHDHNHDATIREGACVMPRIKGIRVYLIYRNVPGEVPHLYAGFYRVGEDTFIALDKLVELGAPRYFGEIRNKVTINNFTPFGDNAMYVVASTIYIPETVAAATGSHDVFEVFDEFLNDDQRVRTREDFNNQDFVDALARAQKDFERTDRLLARYMANGQSAPQKHRDEHQKNRENLERRKADLSTSDPQREYDAYIARLPVSKLRFISHEMYRWNRDGLKTVKLHRLLMGSLGFRSIDHPALEFVGYVATDSDVKKTVNLFEKALDCKVEALIIQPSLTASVRFADVSRINV